MSPHSPTWQGFRVQGTGSEVLGISPSLAFPPTLLHPHPVGWGGCQPSRTGTHIPGWEPGGGGGSGDVEAGSWALWGWGCWVGTLLSLWDLPLKSEPSTPELSKDRRERAPSMCGGLLSPRTPLDQQGWAEGTVPATWAGVGTTLSPDDETPWVFLSLSFFLPQSADLLLYSSFAGKLIFSAVLGATVQAMRQKTLGHLHTWFSPCTEGGADGPDRARGPQGPEQLCSRPVLPLF